jgi:1-aminocyclopropane-1-carboxylate deaminase/D-cysteine desulfhydrase-like pyridoxal-dependent ACC family enzyme
MLLVCHSSGSQGTHAAIALGCETLSDSEVPGFEVTTLVIRKAAKALVKNCCVMLGTSGSYL